MFATRIQAHRQENTFPMVTLADIQRAQILLNGVAVRTPLLEWTAIGDSRKLFLKLENLQPMGAFKLRGPQQDCLAKVRRAPPRSGELFQRKSCAGRGICGAGLGREAVIVMPGNAPQTSWNLPLLWAPR